MGRWTRATAAATVVSAGLALSACGSASAPEPTGTGTVTETVVRAGTSEAERIAMIRLCQQTITSAGVMVRDYNAFIKRLNAVQDYRKVGAEARWAVDTLNTGADLVRRAVAPDVPEAVDAQVQAFVTSSEQLAEQIEGKRRQSLNRVSDTWSGDRTALLETCSKYLPAGG